MPSFWCLAFSSGLYVSEKYVHPWFKEISSSPSSSSVTSYFSIVLFQPRLIFSTNVFQIFVSLVYSSALFMPSCSCTFLLHVVANLICFFLDSLSTSSAFSSCKISLFLMWSKRLYPAVLLENFISIDVGRILSFLFSKGPNFVSKSKKRLSPLYTFMLENFWTKVGLKVMFGIPSGRHFFNSVCVLLTDGSSKVLPSLLSCRTGRRLPPVGPDCGPRHRSVRC